MDDNIISQLESKMGPESFEVIFDIDQLRVFFKGDVTDWEKVFGIIRDISSFSARNGYYISDMDNSDPIKTTLDEKPFNAPNLMQWLWKVTFKKL